MLSPAGKTDKSLPFAAEILHAGLVAEDAAAGTFAGGING